jgi:hypothetical protein
MIDLSPPRDRSRAVFIYRWPFGAPEMTLVICDAARDIADLIAASEMARLAYGVWEGYRVYKAG